MKLIDLYKVMSGINYSCRHNPAKNRLPRLAIMCGLPVTTVDGIEYSDSPLRDIDVPAEIAAQIMRLDYAERMVAGLADGMTALGKLRVEIPTNINVWQHTKGESALRAAADSMTEAVKALAVR